MSTYSFDTGHFAQTVLGPAEDAVVNPGLFGGIMIDGNAISMPHFALAYEQMALRTISWPGGTISETGYFIPGTPNPRPLLSEGGIPEGGIRAFDLDYPELMHPDLLAGGGRAGLTDIMAYAVETGSTLSIKIPTNGYFEGAPADPADIVHAYTEMKELLLRLYAPTGDLYGKAPPGLIFELGNERYDNPELSYGPIAVAFCLAAREIRAEFPEADFRLALQAMQTPAGSLELIEAFEDPIQVQLGADGTIPSDLLNEIDIIRHHDLGHDVGQAALMEDIKGQEIDAIRPFYDAITRAGGDAGLIKLFCSAFSAAAPDFPKSFFTGNPLDTGNDIPLSLPSTAALAALITSLVQEGVDYGAIWGINTDAFTTTALTHGSSRPIFTPLGEAYRMMSEAIQGCKLIEDAALDFTRKDTDVFRYAFVDDSKAVVIVAADDLPTNSEAVTIRLEGFGAIGNVWLESLTASNGSYGNPILRKEALTVVDGSVTFTLSSDFEFTRLIIARATPGNGQLLLWGGEGAETLLGGTAGDRIEANDGADRLIGRGGNDTLSAGAGNDLVRPGGGRDSVSGGEGFDTLDLSAAKTRQVLDLSETIQTGLHLKGEWIAEFEAALGGHRNDLLKGNADGNFLGGNGGNDRLLGGSGDDTLKGGGKDDTLSGGFGADLMVGGKGADHFRFAINPDTDVIQDFNARIDQLEFSASSPIDSREELLNHAEQDGSSVLIQIGQHGSLRLADFTLQQLETASIVFL